MQVKGVKKSLNTRRPPLTHFLPSGVVTQKHGTPLHRVLESQTVENAAVVAEAFGEGQRVLPEVAFILDVAHARVVGVRTRVFGTRAGSAAHRNPRFNILPEPMS